MTINFKILSIDDNNIRGVVSLKFLRLLQDVIELTLLIQDFFDQAFGTSSSKHWCIFFTLHAN